MGWGGGGRVNLRSNGLDLRRRNFPLFWSNFFYAICCASYAVCCAGYAVCCARYALCCAGYAVCRNEFAIWNRLGKGGRNGSRELSI